ncbi:hypothetical protein ACFQ1I_34570 [Kitasatospora arboriphila]
MQVGAADLLAAGERLGLRAQRPAPADRQLHVLLGAPAAGAGGGGEGVEVGGEGLGTERGGGGLDALQDVEQGAQAEQGVRDVEFGLGGEAADRAADGADLEAAQFGEDGGGGARVLALGDGGGCGEPRVGVGGQGEAALVGIPAELLAGVRPGFAVRSGSRGGTEASASFR